MAAGHELYAYLPGGASGGILPARLADVPLDFDTLQPHGCFIGSAAVIVLSQRPPRAAVDAARNLMRFFAHESCGQCTPCRAGTAKASALIEAGPLGSAAAGRAVAGDARCVDLRPGPGGAEPGRLRDPLLPRGTVSGHERRRCRPSASSSTAARSAPLAGESLLDVADREGVSHPAAVRCAGPASRWATAAPAWSRSTASACSPPSCCRAPQAGMKVHSRQRARAQGAAAGAGAAAKRPARDRLHAPQRGRPTGPSGWASAGRASRRARSRWPTCRTPASRCNLDACIQCTRCLRACRESQGNGVIGLAYSAGDAKIVFDMDDALGGSTCVGCGECVQACPTGALAPAGGAALQVPDRSVDSLCPYCGVGCQLTYHVKDERILYVEGRDGPANHGRLCVKGRYGYDYVRHPQRLTRAADPQGRRAEGPGAGATRPAGRLPRGQLGRGAGPGRRRAAPHPRRARRQGAGRLRLGQGQQRGGLPVPEAGAAGLRQQQRRPLHAAVPCVQRGGAARRHRLGRGQQPGDGRAERRGGDRHRRQPDREPPGGGDLDQERGGPRHEADRDGPAPQRAGAPCRALPAVQARHRRGAAQRDDARHRARRPGRRAPSSLRAPKATPRWSTNVQGYSPEAMAPICGIPRRHDPRRGAAVRQEPRIDDPVGHGHQPACARHRQRALPDRAGADDRPDRPPRHGAAPAARPEQRAGRERRRA